MAQPKTKDEFKKYMADQFIHLLEQEPKEWKKCWKAVANAPLNAVTQKKYRGMNSFTLSIIQATAGKSDPRWATFNQIADKKGLYHKGQKWHLKAGSKGAWIEHPYLVWFQDNRWVPVTQKEINELMKKVGKDNLPPIRMQVKHFLVFNGDDIEGLPALDADITKNFEIQADELIEKLSKNMEVPISYDGGDNAYYNYKTDTIHLPEASVFDSKDALNATALHELAHSTGAKHRLNRGLEDNHFASEGYAFEELVAEMTSCFLSVDVPMEDNMAQIENHEAYLQCWVDVIKEKPNVLVDAVKKSSQASNYMEYKAELITKKEYDTLLSSDANDEEVSPAVSAETEKKEKVLFDNKDLSKKPQESNDTIKPVEQEIG